MSAYTPHVHGQQTAIRVIVPVFSQVVLQVFQISSIMSTVHKKLYILLIYILCTKVKRICKACGWPNESVLRSPTYFNDNTYYNSIKAQSECGEH